MRLIGAERVTTACQRAIQRPEGMEPKVEPVSAMTSGRRALVAREVT